jgi:DNA-binding transcriptional MocR family regulator
MDDRPASLVETTAAFIRGRIADRALARGARLPSVRELAAKLDVSKSTVVEAYDRLAAEGAVAARRGAGFFVAGASQPLTLTAANPPPEPAVDPSWINRHAMTGLPDFLCPGAGWLPDSWVLDLGVQRAMRLTARADFTRRRQYDEPLGHAPLRRLFSVRLAERGVMADSDQIVVTDSCSQALDLVCRFLLSPNDAVVVDDPCYFNFHALLRANRVTTITVPLTPDGPDVVELERVFSERRPRLYLTSAGLQNPTGAIASPAIVHRVLRLAEEHDVLILEDDTFADFEAEPSTRLAALDGFRRVVQVGSATKAVGAAMRCGYIAARQDWIPQLVDLKLATTMGNSATGAAILHRVLTESGYRRHLDGLRRKLADAMGRTLQMMRAHGLEPWIEPCAGIYLWARLPDGVSAAAVARYALTRKMMFAPGPAFSASDESRSCLRFNVSRCGDPRVYEILDEAIAAARRAEPVQAAHDAL